MVMVVMDAEKQKKGFGRSRRSKLLISAAAVLVLGGMIGSVALIQISKNPSFCSSCHIIEPYYESWKEGNLLASKHQAADVNCLDCHHKSYIEKAEEGLRYITGSYSNPLQEINFTRDQCLECHGDDFEKAVAATDFAMSNPHDSHLGEIDCSLCHKMHRQSEVYCSQCHEFDWYEDLDSSWKVGEAAS